MSEHFTAAHVGHTIEWWCPVCKRETTHRVDAVSIHNPAGRLGPCLEHGPRVELTKSQQERRARQRQGELFT